MKQNARPLRASSGRALTSLVLFGVLAASALAWLATPVCGATRFWTGDSSSRWSDPNNWDPVGVPQNGEVLYFDDSAFVFGPDPMVNDITNLVADSLIFHITATVTEDWVLNGNTLTLTRAIDCFDNDRVHINCGLKLAGDAKFEAGEWSAEATELYLNGPIDLNGHNLKLYSTEDGALIAVSGTVSGDGDVHIYDFHYDLPNGTTLNSSVEFNGTQGNNFHGALFLHAYPNTFHPHVFLNKQSGVVITDTLRVESAGSVTLGHANQFGAGATVVLEAGSQLLFLNHDQTMSYLILTNFHADADSTLVDTGTGTLTLLGGITSWVDNDQGALPTIKGRLNLPSGTHNFDVSGFNYAGLDLQAQIVGEGGFSKFGDLALILEDNNTFSGAIEIVQGIIDVRSNGALGSAAGGVTLSESGSLTLRNATVAGKTLVARGNRPITVDTSGSMLFTVGTCVWSDSIVLDTNLTIFGDNTFLTGPISGSGGLDLRNGNVQLAGPTANTFTGATLVRCPLLQFNKSSGVNAFAGPLVVGGGVGGPYEARWLNSHQNSGAPVTLFSNAVINLNNFNEDFGPVTFNGGRVETGTGTFAIYQPLTVNPTNVTVFINGYLSLPGSSPRYFNIGDGSADPDLLVNAIVFGGAPDFFKQGPGTMRLSGANTYTGVTVVDEGILQIDNSSSLGGGGNPAVVHSNATLRLGIFGTIAKPFFLSGTGAGGEGAVSVINGGSWTVTGFVLLDNPSSIRVGIDAGLSINNVITGSGPLTKFGPGILSLGGAGDNTYTGDTIVNAGTLNLAKNPFVVAVPGGLVLGPASPTAPAMARFFQSGGLNASNVTVNANSLLDLNGWSQTWSALDLNDGGSVQTGAGVLGFSGGAIINVGSQSVRGSSAGSSIAGRLALPPNDSVTFRVRSFSPLAPLGVGPELDVPAVITVNGFENSNFALAGFSKEGFGRMRLGGNNTYRGGSFVNGGTLQVDGVQPQGFVSVGSGAQLQGSGTVGQIYFNGSSGVIAPGGSPGILTCSNFNFGAGADGMLRVELSGTAPGAGYDQVNVRGTVTLTGITLSGSLNFASAINNQFVIINNDGADPVIGTFTGLPQNTSFYIGGEQFTISYTGGSGNDVVLRRLPTPPRPALVIEPFQPASVRLLWPASFADYTLQFSTNVIGSNWMTATPLPVVIGTNNVVTNATTDTRRFYRLYKP